MLAAYPAESCTVGDFVLQGLYWLTKQFLTEGKINGLSDSPEVLTGAGLRNIGYGDSKCEGENIPHHPTFGPRCVEIAEVVLVWTGPVRMNVGIHGRERHAWIIRGRLHHYGSLRLSQWITLVETRSYYGWPDAVLATPEDDRSASVRQKNLQEYLAKAAAGTLREVKITYGVAHGGPGKAAASKTAASESSGSRKQDHEESGSFIQQEGTSVRYLCKGGKITRSDSKSCVGKYSSDSLQVGQYGNQTYKWQNGILRGPGGSGDEVMKMEGSHLGGLRKSAGQWDYPSWKTNGDVPDHVAWAIITGMIS